MDIILSLYAVGAFVAIGVGLASLILFTKAKFVASDVCEIKINEDRALKVEGATHS